MPERRMLHTKIWHCEQFVDLKPIERLLYIGMITIADDEGRLKGEARYLRSLIFPYDKISDEVMKKMRDEIVNAGLIIIYETQNCFYIQHPNWTKYQKLRRDRSKRSDFPPPPSDIWQPDVNHLSAEVKATEEKEIEANGEGFVLAGEAMLKAMPNGGKGTIFARKLHS